MRLQCRQCDTVIFRGSEDELQDQKSNVFVSTSSSRKIKLGTERVRLYSLLQIPDRPLPNRQLHHRHNTRGLLGLSSLNLGSTGILDIWRVIGNGSNSVFLSGGNNIAFSNFTIRQRFVRGFSVYDGRGGMICGYFCSWCFGGVVIRSIWGGDYSGKLVVGVDGGWECWEGAELFRMIEFWGGMRDLRGERDEDDGGGELHFWL
ncbi:hypothetical protein E6O75_ATG03703 [Venturia nashicola]|uniref:Uncharacterized protein n=1 Tax=Venturia nashicola TaxID=86259 RepID=A0A4Z1PPK4_9PEZI|nr:hypothetical protein E6O75_ATG03703 [Venturia nashicola]